ncbi:MAG: type II CAAX prenyl endopeptidase Rce1 family protein [Mycobacterium leprae]
MERARWFAFRPDRSAWHAFVVTAGGIVVVSGLLRAVPPHWQGSVVAITYSIWLALALAYGYRVSSLAAVGLTSRRLLPGTVAAIAVALLGVAGSLQDPTMVGAALVLPDPPLLLAMLVTTLAAAFAEQLVFAGYLQLRMEAAFGRLAGILAYATLFTGFHVALIWLPGAVPPSGGGMTQFVGGLFAASCLVALIFTYARNVWAMALAGCVNAMLLNLYRLSVRPDEVLVADPSVLRSGLPLLLGWFFAVWLTGRMIRGAVPGWLNVPLRRRT